MKKLALASALAICAFATPALASPSFPRSPCGHIMRQGETFYIYSGGGLSCSTSTKLIEGFAFGGAKQHGTSDANSYWTIPTEPGFKCIQSAGQGECYKGKQIAGYKIKTVVENEGRKTNSYAVRG